MIAIKENILLAPYTIYKIGGPARFFADIKNTDELKEALTYAAHKNIPFVILGAGSNVLISDKGFDGLIIHMTGGNVSIEGERMHVDAGVMMARAVAQSGHAGLRGFEWGIGVPGSIGGSIRGNAGCFGGEMKDIVESVDVFDSKTSAHYTLQAIDCHFAYRDSYFKTHPELVILCATLKLALGNQEVIQKEIHRIVQERLAKQDIGSKCCGCIFKNIIWPNDVHEREKLMGHFPDLLHFRDRHTIPSAFLIDRAGLKGMRSGAISISHKHANFFVNDGGGTSKDVMVLIHRAKDEVKKKFDINLEEEIYVIGSE